MEIDLDRLAEALGVDESEDAGNFTDAELDLIEQRQLVDDLRCEVARLRARIRALETEQALARVRADNALERRHRRVRLTARRKW